MVLLKSDPKTLRKGSPAPDFALRNVDGSTVRLSDFKGKAVIIIFMCNHCPYVKPKMQEIADIQNQYAKTGVVVIGINANDPFDYPEDDFGHMQEIAMEYGYRHYLVDETQDVAKAYGATCTPDPFVFDKNHTLIYHGRINNAMEPSDKPTSFDLRDVLDAMLKGKEPKKWFEPSMGCSIKWRN